MATTKDIAASSCSDATSVKLNVLFMSFGSRGDLQPHLEIAKVLQRRHGHRVRLVCPAKYRRQVEAEGVEFYCYGDADPGEMIRRRLLPRAEMRALMPTIRAEFAQMAERYWKACVGDPEGLPDDGPDAAADREPFLADVVIASMQMAVHSWMAARMGVPLHMIGTNPRSPSRYLPHSQDAGAAAGDSVVKNKLSWLLRDFMFLQAMRTEYNHFRLQIGLEPFTPLWYMSQWNRLRVPFTNIWSPNFLPKAKDWGEHIDVAGFVFCENPDYEPPADLTEFLAGGDRTIYVGFGSAYLPDSEKIFSSVSQALSQTKVRAVVLRGSSTIEPGAERNPNIFLTDDCPHDWLFPRMSAVIIHGGAGATAMALKSGRPTLVCPVSGDMAFWGQRVWQAGCGPEPLPYTDITADALAGRIEEMMQPKYAAAAADMAAKIATEEPGAEGFARRAHQTFSVYEQEGRCEVLPSKPAAWKYTQGGSTVRLSAVAAHVLMQQGRVTRPQLELLELVKWPDLVSPGDPVTGLLKGVGKFIGNVRRDLGRRNVREQILVSSEKNGDTKTHDRSFSSILFGILFLLIHTLRAPITIMHFILFGFYNLIDFISYELGSHTSPDLFASNPRLYSYPKMLGFLFLKPFKELGSVAQRPLQFPLAIVRFFTALLNVPVGFFALSVRAADIEMSRLMGERPKNDVVAEAKLSYGKLEAEHLERRNAEEGVRLVDNVVKAWDEMKH